MKDPNKQDRIVASRLKLMARFKKKMEANDSISNDNAQGTGPLNRHGKPQVPVGQYVTEKWPILDLGVHPKIEKEKWTLKIDGAVENPIILSWSDFMSLPQTKATSDFHCVTSWSKLDMPWKGVLFQDLAAFVMPMEKATHILCHGTDGYTTNIALEEALKPDVLLGHTVYNAPLQQEHGGPVRMITPQLYAWKGAKWIRRIEFLFQDQAGFWEKTGYSNTARPWQNDRYRLE